MTDLAQHRPASVSAPYDGAVAEMLHRAGPLTVRRSRRTGRAGTIAIRVVAVMLGLLLPMLALEVALRLFGPFLPGNYDTGSTVRRDALLGHFHPTSTRTWVKTPQFTTEVDFNPMGLRDPRQSYAKPPGTFRILALGDSYLEGEQVPSNATVAAQMESMLGSDSPRPVEVINGGVLGYGTTQEYLLLDTIGAKLQPDLVVLFFCDLNDLSNNNYRLDLINGDLKRALKPYFDLDDNSDELRLIPAPPPSPRTSLRERLRDYSLLYNVIETGVVYKLELDNPQEPFNGIGGLEDPTRGKFDANPSGEWDRAWRITEDDLKLVRDRAAEMGALLVIVSIPERRMLDREYWQRDANKRLVDAGKGGPDAIPHLMDGIAQRLGVPHLDLGQTFQSKVDADGLLRYYIEGDFHWTAEGHAVAAQAVNALLKQRGLVP